MKAKAVVWRKANTPTLEEIELPALKPNEMRIRIEYSGVSIGTESSIFSGVRTHNGTFPLVVGYMSCGIVEELGSNTQRFSVGDRVIAIGSRIEGDINSVWGGHMSQRIVEDTGAFGVPDSVSSQDASMFILPCVSLNAVSMVGMSEADTVLIQGQGLIGQFFGQFARNRGAKVIAIEPSPDRAALSRKYVTRHVFDPNSDDIKARIDELTDGKGPTIVVEGTGNKKLISTAQKYLTGKSKFVFLGWYPDQIELNYHQFHFNEVVVYFPMGSGDDKTVRAVLDNMAQSSLVVGDNITDIVPFAKACQGYQRIINGDRTIMGMVIDWRNA